MKGCVPYMGSIPSLSECKPGFNPVEYNVVIAPKRAQEKTIGGIIIPASTQEKDEAAEVWGLLVGASPLAFNYDQWPDGATRPEPGDQVLYAKYAGILVNGDDGQEYRILKDKDIMAFKDRPEGQ